MLLREKYIFVYLPGWRSLSFKNDNLAVVHVSGHIDFNPDKLKLVTRPDGKVEL